MESLVRDPQRLLFIAGPCALESEAVCRAGAEALVEVARKHPEIQPLFKGSFDKANRTGASSPRGPGLEEGLRLLATIRNDYGLPVLTDIHEPAQAAPAAEVCSVLQIPAFLCRQTDLLLAAAQTGAVVKVKKGQFLAPADARFIVEKLERGGAREIWLTERGTTFGYGNLVVDMRAIAILRRTGCPVIFDATHAVQMPGTGSGQTGGQREFIYPLTRAALAAGADGLFAEIHPDPAKAISDGPNQLPVAELPRLADQALAAWSVGRQWRG